MTPRTSGAPIQFEHVWKHYQTGGTHDSLRDMLLPEPAGLDRRSELETE